jgi:hypothetical protein
MIDFYHLNGWGLLVIILSLVLLFAAIKNRLNEFNLALSLTVVTLIANYPYIIDGTLGPNDDSKVYHYPFFAYIADHIAHYKSFPNWFSDHGGVRAGFFQMNLGFLLPHRLAGYAIYFFFPENPLVVYKFSIVISVCLSSVGVALFVGRWLQNPISAYLSGLLMAFGGFSTTFHQEQAFFTFALAPWFLIALLEISKNKQWLIVLGCLLGLSATLHYPQIQFVALLSLALIYGAFNSNLFWSKIKSIVSVESTTGILTLFALLIPLGSLFYFFVNKSGIRSPLREQLVPNNHTEYVSNQFEQTSSASLEYMFQYLYRETLPHYIHPPDIAAFYLSLASLLVGLMALVLNFRQAAPVFTLLIVFTFLTMGVYSPIPFWEFLYKIAPWFFAPFRQWYHFLVFQQASVIFLFAIGLNELLKLKVFQNLIALHCFLPIFVLWMLLDLQTYRSAYFDKSSIRYSSALISDPLSRNPDLLQYKARQHLCKKNISTKPFVATKVLPEPKSGDWDLCEIQDRYGKEVALINQSTSSNGVFEISFEQSFFKFIESKKVSNGFVFDVEVSEKALLVMPVNFDLGVDVSIDGKPVKIYRANGALTAVVVAPGAHVVSIKVKPDLYVLASHLTILLTVMIAFYIPLLLSGYVGNQKKSSTS